MMIMASGPISPVEFSCSVVSSSLRPHREQHARLPCPSPTPRACSNSCPSSRWCHQAISSSVIPFSSCLQSFPVSGSFPLGQFFASGGQSIGASVSASVPPMNIQDWFSLGLTGLISLQSRGLSRVFSNTTVQKHQFWSHHIKAHRWRKNGNSDRLFSWAPKSDGDYRHEIKRHLLLRRKAMTNLNSILKSRDITLPTKVHIVKAMVFSSSHVWMWVLDH